MDLGILNLMHNIKPLIGAPKHCMFPVQPGCLLSRDKELRTIGIGSSICHANSVWLVMLEVGEFVFEFFAPYTLPSSSITQRIATLET